MKPRLSTYILTPLAVITILGFGWVGFKKLSSMRTFAKRKPVERKAVGVRTQSLTAHNGSITLRALGQLRPSREVTIQAEVAGRVVELASQVVPGGVVKKGQMLIKLDKQDYALAVSQRRAQLESARMQLKQEEGRQNVAKREWALMGAQKNVTEAGKALALRKPQVANARAAVKGARSAVSTAALALKRTQIKAPFDAVVLSEQVEVGQRIGPGQNVVRLAGTQTWWVEVSLPLEHLQYLEIPGAKARVFQGQLDNIGRTGRVVRQLPDVERTSQLARVVVEISNPMDSKEGQRLLLGAAVRVDLTGSMKTPAVKIPVGLLRGNDTVWTVDAASKLRIATLRVLWRDLDFVIATGVKPGIATIVNHIPNAADGLPLRALNDSGDGDEPKTVARPKDDNPKVSN